MRKLRREGHAGKWPDQRLRPNRCRTQRQRRLVRSFNSERAVSCRRQEDYGLRTLRAAWGQAARRHHLPLRRRSRRNCHVESFRRDGTTRLDKFGTTEDDCRPGRWMRAPGQSLAGTKKLSRDLARRIHGCCRSQGTASLWRLSGHKSFARESGNCRFRHR